MLITGALGGVGRTAVHVAKKHGAYVIAGVRASQRAEAEKLGVDEVVAVDEHLGGLKELDAVADTVGRDVIDRLIPYIRKNGVLATVVGKPKSAAWPRRSGPRGVVGTGPASPGTACPGDSKR